MHSALKAENPENGNQDRNALPASTGGFALLGEEEQRQILYEWNQTQREYPKEKCVHELFEEQVKRTPEAIAVVMEGASLSYGELNRQANRLAHHLREIGVKADTRVGICLERSTEMIVGVLGVLKAGGAYVPLDPEYPADRLQFMLADSALAVLLTQGPLRRLFPGISADLLVLDLIDGVAWKDQPETNPERDAVGLTSGHLAYVIYTSGSTGVPKGVMVEHRGIVRLVCNTDYVQLGAEDVIAQASNASFDAATFEIWGALLAGARLVKIDKNTLLSPAVLAQDLREKKISVFFLTTAMFNQVASEAVEAFANLRYLLFGGERVEPRWVARVQREAKVDHFLHVYGPTETVTYASWHEIRRVEEGRTVPIGKPLANTRMYILDDQGEPVPVGAVGELYIGGAGVARGYWKRAEVTAERFVPDRYVEGGGERLYRTGDLGQWLKDGTIEFVGRNDDQVKIRGFRVELGEVEAEMRRRRGVGEAVVVLREEERGEKRLVVYYTQADAEDQDAADKVNARILRAHLLERLPEYMVPAAYVRLEEIPLTRNGKLDRKALPPPSADAYAVRTYEAPEGENEKVVAAIWANVLKIERVGRQDNFFELGGHSLLAVRVVSRIRQTLSVNISQRDLFVHPQLADLVRNLVSATSAEFPQIARAQQRDYLPLSYAQQRLWFLAQI
ncbi:MAG TPA: amino acid adenylation domain-containing protein, partial [Candidatus Angelobacter sp.]